MKYNVFYSHIQSFLRVYPLIREVIKESESRDNPEQYYNFRVASIKSKWFNDNFLSRKNYDGLKNALININTDSATQAYNLQVVIDKKVAKQVGATGNKNFKQLEILLPKILKELLTKDSENTTAKFLLDRIIYEQRLTNELFNDTFNPKDIISDNSSKEYSLQSELLINQIINDLSKNDAHKARMLISRSDNKLKSLVEFINMNQGQKNATV
jgi:hypothetical protein